MSGHGREDGGLTARWDGYQARDHCSRQCFNICAKPLDIWTKHQDNCQLYVWLQNQVIQKMNFANPNAIVFCDLNQTISGKYSI